jgi:hypothetical protein
VVGRLSIEHRPQLVDLRAPQGGVQSLFENFRSAASIDGANAKHDFSPANADGGVHVRVKTRQSHESTILRQSLLLRMRDEGSVKFNIHKGQWFTGSS